MRSYPGPSDLHRLRLCQTERPAAAPFSRPIEILFLAFRFSSAVTCAQSLAAQALADGSEKFPPLARSRQNFLAQGGVPMVSVKLLQRRTFGRESCS
nr:hypothetical protein EU244_23810 [Rhodococcus qingshengii]